jgi:dihydrodipicolinate reductase
VGDVDDRRRELLADGALRAVAYIKTKQKGLYSMKELLLEASGKTVVTV